MSYEYNQQGLLSRSRDAKGNYSSYEFDSRGLLTSDTDAAGFKKTYGRNYDLNHNDVEAKSPMGRVRKFTSQVTQSGALSRAVTASDGTVTTSVEDANHNQRVISAQGDISTTVSQADPRFGLSASLPRSTNRVTPEGVTAKASLTKTVSLSNDSDFLSLQTLVNQTSYEGLGTYTSSYDRTAKTLTETTPSGFVSKQSFNSKGRVSKIEVSQFSPLEISYDSTGRVISKTQGSRTQSSAYNAQGRLASETNALGHITRYSYDSVGRINQIQKPDGRSVKMNFDDNDNLLSVTLPKNQVHSYSFDSLNQMLVNLVPSLSGVNSDCRRKNHIFSPSTYYDKILLTSTEEVILTSQFEETSEDGIAL